MSDQTAFEKLQSELFPKESLLWYGRPIQGLRFVPSDLFGIGIGILLLTASVALLSFVFGIIPLPFYLKDNTGSDPRPAMVIVGAGFLGLGLYLAGGSYYLSARLRRQLFYGVTNERLLFLQDRGRRGESLTSMRIGEVPHLSITADKDGTGSLIFFARSTSGPQYNSVRSLSFFMIPEVKKVYSLIRGAQGESFQASVIK